MAESIASTDASEISSIDSLSDVSSFSDEIDLRPVEWVFFFVQRAFALLLPLPTLQNKTDDVK